jgi:hypothetical protein
MSAARTRRLATPLTEQREEFAKLLPEGITPSLRLLLWHVFCAGCDFSSQGRINPNTADAIACTAVTNNLSATSVLQRWETVSAVFGGKLEPWMRLIRIAAAGERGLTHHDLFPRTNGWSQLKPYLQAGLLETVKQDIPGRAGPKVLRIRITRKGLRFLRMDTEQTATFPA